MDFRDFRNLELSTIEYIASEITANWGSSVIVEKSFAQAKKRWTTRTPVVCVRVRDISPVRKEIGSTNYRYETEVVIDVFGTSDGNRLDLAAQLTDSLKENWNYKTYSKESGIENPVGTATGDKMRTFNWNQNSKLEFGDEVSAEDKYRHILSFVAGVR